jgi:hypothetical protein
MTGWLPESLLHDVGSWAASQHRSRVATPRTASEWPSMEWTAPARQCSPINSLRSCATAAATSYESRSTPSTTLGPCATGEGALLQRASGSTATTCALCTSGFCNRSVRAATVATGRPRTTWPPTCRWNARAGRASRGGPRLGRALPAPRRAPRYLGPVDLSAGAIRCLGCAHGRQGRWLRRSGASEPDALRAGPGPLLRRVLTLDVRRRGRRQHQLGRASRFGLADRGWS